jgi:hypothetical protein
MDDDDKTQKSNGHQNGDHKESPKGEHHSRFEVGAVDTPIEDEPPKKMGRFKINLK